jgi:hypothetical protein
MKKEKLHLIKKHLKREKCASGKELARRFSLSLRRLSDYLRSLGCWTSYSHKRKFYALPESAKFSKERIWQCHPTGALFTDLGSLNALVEWHVRQSSAGLTCRELSEITRIRVEPQIVRISKERGLVREKFDGEYVYFYRANEKTYRRQIAQRRRFSSRTGPAPEAMLDIEVESLQRDLKIALAFLNYPQKSGAEIVTMLRKEGLRLTINELVAFLIRYNIKKKDDRLALTQFEFFRAATTIQARLLERGIPPEKCCIVFEPSITGCPRCKNLLNTLKTTPLRQIGSIRFGEFWVKERVKTCQLCQEPQTWHSNFPKLLAPPKRTFAYDVMVFAGEQKFLYSRTLKEIRKTLAEDPGLSISPSLLSLYVQEFCYRFECLHYAKLAKLAEWTREEQLGYMLHVDCSSEFKSDTIFVAYDRTSEIVLVSEKIPSERTPFLVPVLQKVKKYMGDPVSGMSDLGLGIIKALEEVFPGVERRICHFHFIRDVGKDLLDRCYGELRTKLNDSKINAHLNALERDVLSEYSAPDVSWICPEEPLIFHCTRKRYEEVEPVLVLHFIRSCRKVKSSTGFGYPFDIPWARYAEEISRQAIEVQNCLAALRERRIKPKVLSSLFELLSPFLPEGHMYEEIDPLIRSCLIRENQVAELREVMRLRRPKKGRAPLSALYGVNSRKEIVSFNKDLRQYKENLKGRLSSKVQAFRKEGYQVILKHIEKYWGNLILHPSLWRALKCQVVDRTNNLPESGHRDSKQSLRKSSGRKRIDREFSDYGPYLPMISNLKKAKYVECVLGEYKNLPLEFALLDPNEVAYYRERFQEEKHGAMFRAVRAVSEAGIL